MTEWIKCSERLPLESQEVIVFDPIYDKPVFQSQYANKYFKQSFQVNWTHQVMGENDTVTHWMPLPEPPKES